MEETLTVSLSPSTWLALIAGVIGAIGVIWRFQMKIDKTLTHIQHDLSQVKNRVTELTFLEKRVQRIEHTLLRTPDIQFEPVEEHE